MSLYLFLRRILLRVLRFTVWDDHRDQTEDQNLQEFPKSKPLEPLSLLVESLDFIDAVAAWLEEPDGKLVEGSKDQKHSYQPPQHCIDCIKLSGSLSEPSKLLFIDRLRGEDVNFKEDWEGKVEDTDSEPDFEGDIKSEGDVLTLLAETVLMLLESHNSLKTHQDGRKQRSTNV